MDGILQGLLDLPGVNAAMVFDGGGQLVAQRGRAVYDRALCEQVGAVLARAVDSAQLQHPDWEAITAQFADGKLLLRNLGAPPGGQGHVLAVVADPTMNPSFATVAIRVAANKLRKALENPGAASTGASSAPGAGSSAPPASASGSQPGTGSRPVLANSGLSWSKSSSVALSGITVADPATGSWLARCTKELARFVGPMAKVYVEEAVRRVSPEAPFSMASAKALTLDLGGQIEDRKDRVKFLEAVGSGN